MMETIKETSRKIACCFTGPRPASLPFGMDENSAACLKLKQIVKEQAVNLIKAFGVTHFISGVDLGVGQYAAEIVLDLKKDYPGITLECVSYCENQAVNWSVAQRERYFSIIAQCDKETLIQHNYTKDCRRKRREYMITQSQYILAVWNGRPGNARNFLSLARKIGRPAIVINPDTLEVSSETVRES